MDSRRKERNKREADIILNEAKRIGVRPWDPLATPMDGAPDIQPKTRLPDIPFSYGRHLDSALEKSKIDFYREHPKMVQKRHPGLSPQIFRPIVNGAIGGILILPWLLEHILSVHASDDWSNNNTRELVIDVVQQAMELQLLAVSSVLAKPLLNGVQDRMERLRRSPHLRVAFKKKEIVFAIHRMIYLGGQVYNGFFRLDKFPDWKFYKDLVILTEFPAGPTAVPFSFLLASLDKLEAVFSLEVALETFMGSWDKVNSKFDELTRKIYYLLDDAYNRAGNSAVDLFKGLETLALGSVLQALPKGRNDHEFLPRAISSLVESSPELTGTVFEIAAIFKQYIQDFGDNGIRHVLETYGQEKMHHFPIIDSADGLLKMYRIGVGYRWVDDDVVQQGLGMLSLLYLTQHKLLHGCLPAAFLPSNLDSRLAGIFKSGELPSFSECLKIPLQLWASIQLKAHHLFNYVENELGLLDDKSVAPSTSKWRQCYHPDSLEALGETIERYPDETRLIMDMLRKQSVEVKAYFEECEKLGEIPYEWRLIRLKLKERELKLIGRAFSILHPNTRHMASVAEQNISNIILKYFGQQSMTKSGVELKQTIDDFTGRMKPGNHRWVAIVLDMYQWNYTFRADLQMPFAQWLDSVFGVEHFTTLQMLFRDAILISGDPYCPPGLGDRFLAWIHHAGGNQGIFQKFWTLITLVLIKMVMTILGLDHIMTGAGDNQVVIFDTEGHPDPDALIKEVKQALTDTFASVGLKMKPEETWYSDSLFNYQRKYYYQGSPVPTGIKQVVRAFAEGSEGSMGLNNVISTAMNTGVAVASVVCDPLAGPIIAYTEAYVNLLADPRWSSITGLSKPSLSLLSAVNTEMGYLPFIQLHGFYYSGHADHVTDSLSILRKIWERSPDWRVLITPFLQFRREALSDETALSLILDPLTLPNQTGPSPEAFIRGEIEHYLKETPGIVNRRLKTVLSHLDPTVRLLLANELFAIKPVHLSFLHEVLENHIVGQSYQVLNRFTKLGSLARAAEFDKRHKKDINNEEGTEGTFSHRVEALSQHLLRYIVKKVTTPCQSEKDFFDAALGRDQEDLGGPPGMTYRSFCALHSLPYRCTYTLRIYLTSWVSGLLPEQVLGPFCPSPFEQLHWREGTAHLRDGKSLLVAITGQGPMMAQDVHTKVGPLLLYRGTATADSVSVTPLINLKGTTERNNIRALLRLHTWVISLGSDPSLLKLLEDLLQLRLPTCFKELIQMQPVKGGGSMAHRFQGPGEDRGSYINSSSCVSSYTRISSNFLTHYSEGSKDYTIFFQRIYNNILYSLSVGQGSTRQFSVEIQNRCCTVETQNPKFRVGAGSMTITLAPPDGFELPPRTEQDIVAELQHRASFNTASLDHNIDPRCVIAGYLSHQLSTQVYYHEKGLSHDQVSGSTAGRFTMQYNTSHFRECSMEQLLIGVGLQLARQNFLHCERSIDALINKLQTVTALPVVAVDVGPFVKFLVAIVESGKLRDLLWFAPRQPGFLSGSLPKQLLGTMLSGVAKALQQLKKLSPEPVILIEQKHQNQSLRSAAKFLQSNLIEFRLRKKAHNHLSDRALIEGLPRTSLAFIPLLTPDANATLALARQLVGNNTASRSLITGPASLVCPDVQLLIHQQWRPYSYVPTATKPKPASVSLALQMLHKLGKAGSQTSGARLKLMELIIRHKIPVGDLKWATCLADGGGTYSSLLMHINQGLPLLYNTLLSPDQLAPEQLGNSLPPPLLCQHIDPLHLTDLSLFGAAYGDLTQAVTWKEITDWVQDKKTSQGIVTFDMESTSDLYGRSLMQLKDFLGAARPDWLVVKVFAKEESVATAMLVTTVERCYQNLIVDKPSFSSSLSSEVFLVGSGPRENPTLSFMLPWNSICREIWCKNQAVDWHTLERRLFRQLSWRRGVSCCGLLGPGALGVPSELDELPIRSLQSAVNLILSVIQVKSSSSFPLDITNQHMLMGNTKGRVHFWNNVEVALTFPGVVTELLHSAACNAVLDPHQLRSGHSRGEFMKLVVQGIKTEWDRKQVELYYQLMGANLMEANPESNKRIVHLWSTVVPLIRIYAPLLRQYLDINRLPPNQLFVALHHQEGTLHPSVITQACVRDYSLASDLIQHLLSQEQITAIRVVAENSATAVLLQSVSGWDGDSGSLSVPLYLGWKALETHAPSFNYTGSMVILLRDFEGSPRGYYPVKVVSNAIYWGDKAYTGSIVILHKKKKSKKV